MASSTTAIWLGVLGVVTLAAFYWALRSGLSGDREGEEDSRGPGPAYLNRVVAGAVAGMLLVAVGAVTAVSEAIPWSLPAFALGFGLLVYLARVVRPYRHASPTLRRVVQFCDAGLHGSLLAGILVVANVLAFKYGERPFDLTSERTFSLASQTVAQLHSLDRPLRFTIVYTRRSQRQADRIAQLLELYKAENTRQVSYQAISADAEPTEFDELARRVPEARVAGGQDGGVVVEYGEREGARRLLVRTSEMFDMSRRGSDPARFGSTFLGEGALTSAVVRLREGKRTRIALTTGHGEPPSREVEASRPSVGLLRSRLTALGADIIDYNPLSGPLAREVEVAFIIAPQTQFSAREANRLKAYVESGGHLVILLDGRKSTGLEDWLKSFNIEAGKDIIVDPAYNLDGRPWLPGAPIGPEISHPIVEPLHNRTILVPAAVPLSLQGSMAGPGQPRGEPNPSYSAVALVRTGPMSWAESDLTQRPLVLDAKIDQPGPLVVGAAVSDAPREGRPATPRLVVFSSPYMAHNQYVERDEANVDILVNAASWLRGRRDVIGIAPKTHVALTLAVDPVLRQRLVLLPTVLGLAVIAAVGLFVYNARRT
jgi:hypothetical protein